jgi:hypothetical protein
MKIPHFVFHKMEERFGELRPLFLKFAHSNLDLIDIQEIVNKVETDLANGDLKPYSNPYKKRGSVTRALNEACRSLTGEQKLAKIKEIYWKSRANLKDAFWELAEQRCNAECDNPDFNSSWRDYTSVYPDKFDGDNITKGNFHSCKFKDITDVNDDPVWEKGHVCHSIQALTWRISGLYKEFCMEPDVLVSEKSKMSLVEELIRLSHYVLDSSTIVHLMKTGGDFHNNFEEDLDMVIDQLLPEIQVKINDDLQDSFSEDAYGEADKRAKATLKKFYFPILDAYGVDTRDDKPTAKKVFNEGKHLDLAKDIIQNASQNLADFWEYTIEICNLEKAMNEFANEAGIDPST